MRGKKGLPHRDPADPPRRRANRRRGHGTFANDRPPVAGLVGREAGVVRMEVVDHADGPTLVEFVRRYTWPGTRVYTDEWRAYDRLPELGRARIAVSHAVGHREWARDDDGDGVREAHCNTMEGTWTGLRNYLRRFRGVSKHYLGQYVAIFQWANDVKQATLSFLRALLGVRYRTIPRT